jgi:hypothetical protein
MLALRNDALEDPEPQRRRIQRRRRRGGSIQSGDRMAGWPARGRGRDAKSAAGAGDT